MQRLILGMLLVVFGVPIAAHAAGNGDAINGTWLVADGTSKVQITDANGVFEGRVAWLKEPDGAAGKPKTDQQNPDAALRSRPIIGLTVLRGLHYSGNGTWEGGTIYTPATGRSYPCKATLGSDGSLDLAVGSGMFVRTVVWTRASP